MAGAPLLRRRLGTAVLLLLAVCAALFGSVGVALLMVRAPWDDVSRQVFAGAGSDTGFSALATDPSFSGTLLEAATTKPGATDFFLVKVARGGASGGVRARLGLPVHVVKVTPGERGV